jgi:8-oxo-dGTP pyrophosphatase MutT (NUDIX family)
MAKAHNNPWKKLSSEVVHENKWFSVRRDAVITPDGKPREYNVIQQTDAVFIVAMDEDQRIRLVGLYRYTTDMYSLEVPAGNTDGQDPLLAAKRELQEETGLTAKTWRMLGKCQAANGVLNEFCYIFLAQGLIDTEKHQQKEEGITEAFSVSLVKALAMIKSGEITDSQSIVAITYAALDAGVGLKLQP